MLPLLQVSSLNAGANSFQPRIIGCRSRKFLLPLVVQGVLHVGLATRVISLIGFIDQASQFGKSRIRATIMAHVVLFDGVLMGFDGVPTFFFTSRAEDLGFRLRPPSTSRALPWRAAPLGLHESLRFCPERPEWIPASVSLRETHR